jgi:hypothetical protein
VEPRIAIEADRTALTPPSPELTASHTSPVAHCTPHWPQFFASVSSTTQSGPHAVVPGRQLHVPSLQSCPAKHAAPHAEQLRRSEVGSTHPMPQGNVPGLHTTPVGGHAVSNDNDASESSVRRFMDFLLSETRASGVKTSARPTARRA